MAANEQVKSATRYTLIFLNFLFLAVGIAAMAVGGYILMDRKEMRTLTFLRVVNNDVGMLQTAAIIIITSGFMVFGLGVVGCCGACKQTKCLLALYVGAVALALVLTLAATSVALAYRTVVAEELLAKLRDSLITRYQGYITSEDQFSRAMDFAQVEFQCCGVNSWQDYNLTTNWTVRSSAVVPLTCCILDRDAYRKENFYVLQDMACARSPNSTNSNIDTPCYGKIKEWIETQAYVIGGLGIAICVLQLAGMLLALCLMTSWRSKDSDYFYRDSYLRS